ncbi:MAG: hypothetical protein K6G07_03980 [Lachnospiraceae bacterium]|nr:hypothetical protein [Lachnospiraceae bacterium]
MLILQPIGGLCNRMRSINSAKELAKKRNETLTVIWFVNPELGCRFEDIFAPTKDFRIITIHSKWNLRKLFLQFVCTAFGSFLDNTAIRAHKGDGNLEEAFAASLKKNTYIATEEHFYESHDYSSFVPNDTVNEKIESMKEKLGEHAVGVHIRRTDNGPAIGKSSTDAFVSSMEKEIAREPLTHFYVATDDMTEEENLRKLFPDRIISNETRDLSRDSVAGIRDACVDLFSLASTNKIIGSYFSSFTDIAADMHQIPKIVAGV